MRMQTQKTIFFITLMIAAVIKSTAQDITIDLSIRWDDHIDASGNKIQAPFLDITYINNSSDKKYYLLKQSRPNIISNPLPEFYNDAFQWHFRRYNLFDNRKIEEQHLEKLKRVYSNNHFFGQKYYITIDNSQITFHTGWSAKKDTAMPEYYEYMSDNYYEYYRICKEDTIEVEEGIPQYDEMQYALIDAYDSIYISNYGYNVSKRESFLRTEFTDSTISNSAIDNFVFLNPKEQYTTSYNLYGLKLVGGKFEFLFRKSFISDRVFDYKIWDGENFQENLIQLPQNVNGYQLYSGKFKTNHAFLEITE